MILEKARNRSRTRQAFCEILAEIGQATIVRELLRDDLIELFTLGKKSKAEGAAVQVVHALVQVVVEFATSVSLARLAAASVKFKLGFVPNLDNLRGAVTFAPTEAALLADRVATTKPRRTGKLLRLDFHANLFTKVYSVDIFHPAVKILELVILSHGNSGNSQTQRQNCFYKYIIHLMEI